MKRHAQLYKSVVLFLYICFIFSNSLASGADSTRQSGFFVSIAQQILSYFSITINEGTLSFIIRKAAHFSEYFILGILTQAVFHTLNNKPRVLLTALIITLVPIIDESLQLISPERSCEIRDMLIDFSGCCFGILFTFLICSFLHTKNKLH